mgnify:CR=1 FL=1
MTIYLSRLKIIRHQNIEPSIMYKRLSKIRFKAKKDEIKASIEVRKIVKPMEEYFITS